MQIHNNFFCKLNCGSHVAENFIVAMTFSLKLQQWKNHVLQKKADYDQVYYDNVTRASLLSELCEEAKQLGLKCMMEMTVKTACEHGAVKSL